MAMLSNNNSSIGSPSRSNPNARNSETNDPMRKSFSGNPFPKPSILAKPRSYNPNTPANSPSDFPRRNSVGGRESIGSWRDLDDKENGKDQNLKVEKVRSPASALKGTKNFMSPTISASSKITMSPRKKVLIERNEPARTSISSTDGKSPIFKVKIAETLEGSNLKAGIGLEKKMFEALPESDLKPEVRKVTFAVPLEYSKPGIGLEASSGRFPEEETKEEKLIASLISEDLKVEDIFYVQVPLNTKNEAEMPFETATQEPDCVNLDPTFKLGPTPPPFSSTSTILAPLDANPLNTKNEAEMPFETATQEPDCVNLDPTFKLSPTPPPFSSTSTILAPLDADPLMPPYDPKTNYLSPRPQFLHYRPKSHLHEDRDCVTLEESFISGSFSDTDIAEETQSEDSEKESEDVSSDEIVKEDDVQISDPSPTVRLLSKDAVEVERMPKSRFFMRFKAISLLLLLSVACISISVTNSPVIDPSMFEELSIFSKFYESSDFFEFAKANFDSFSEFVKANSDGLARNVHIWFSNLVSSISELISNFGGEPNLAHLHYCNLSALGEDASVDQLPIFSQIEKGGGDLPQLESPLLKDEENGADTEIEIGEDIGDISTAYYSTYEEHFLKKMEATATVETVSRVSEAEEVLESQKIDSATSEPHIEAFEASNQAQEINSDSNAEKVMSVELTHQTGSETSELLIEAFEASNQAQEIDADSNAEKVKSVDLTHQTGSETSELLIEAFEASNQALEIGTDINAEKVMNVDLKDQPELNSEVAESHIELYDDGTGDKQLTGAEGRSESVDAAFRENLPRLEEVDLPQHMLIYVLLLLSLIAAATFNYSKKDNSRSAKVASSVEQPHLSKTLHMSVPKGQTSPDEPSLRNGPTEMEVLGESCPSEMSSFQKSSSYVRKEIMELNEAQNTEKPTKKNRSESLASSDYSETSSFQKSSSYVREETRDLNEAQSTEKKPTKKNRRESLASSDYSMGSPSSYGSFTTYEKIHNKHRHGDENTVTPVRRSSRIRNQATSPL